MEENRIDEFICSIRKGPFACLRQRQADKKDSEAVVEHGRGNFAKIARADAGEPDIFDCAVYQAYLDMCRIVKGAGKGKAKEKVGLARKSAAQFLREYFAGKAKTKEDAFDGWCGSCIFQVRTAGGLTVGQAQKLLNMAFKYLYCCKDIRESAADHFACCHMALDGYTLAWYKKECDRGYDGEAWSSIDDVAKYFRIVENTRSKVKGTSPFLAEFDIWKRETDRAERREIIKWADKIAEYEECPLGLKNALRDFASSL